MTTAEDRFRTWLAGAGRSAYQLARRECMAEAMELLTRSDDLLHLDAALLRSNPRLLSSLRLSTAPPLARERLVTMAYSNRPVVDGLEAGRLPARISSREVDAHLGRLVDVVRQFLDPDIFPWLLEARPAGADERQLACLLVADRRTDSVADQILRAAQRARQYEVVERWLRARDYVRLTASADDLQNLPRGTYYLGRIALDGHDNPDARVDAVIQPHHAARPAPVLLKCVSAPDRSKSPRPPAGRRLRQLADDNARLLLMLSGVVDISQLEGHATAGLDWVWEHRLDDLAAVGL